MYLSIYAVLRPHSMNSVYKNYIRGRHLYAGGPLTPVRHLINSAALNAGTIPKVKEIYIACHEKSYSTQGCRVGRIMLDPTCQPASSSPAHESRRCAPEEHCFGAIDSAFEVIHHNSSIYVQRRIYSKIECAPGASDVNPSN